MSSPLRSLFTPRLLLGSLLLILGLLLMMDSLDVLVLPSIWRYWPLFFAFLGVIKLIQAQTSKERREGFWFVVIGTWLYLAIFRVFGFGVSQSWPILIVAWGVSMIWDARDRRRHLA